jgi:hypothetical protein
MDIKEKVRYMLWDLRVGVLVGWVVLERRKIKLREGK